ncbi:Fur-regulated basic protein FbpA [Domibacillus sp. PGB-M46]|uniref:Fur-regulated basic protein FbpA n=1 Tax=Domibacillus sp. PGB-M46 TaxID=2910255 RepID=UPI001F58D944|nr:Fur-regulated basic protein FbpA [Domibacillus sp. PGB-M46]MCI2256665.1 Fur-regulated basic protein FbpA [Domibacillus sp. PGB-M46]
MILREAVENRRTELINKLIAFGVFKINEKHLFENSLGELEGEYNKFEGTQHPHSQLGSIRWFNKKANKMN